MSPTLHVTAGNKICHDELMLKKHDQTLCCGNCINCVDNKSPNAYMVKIRGIKNNYPVDCATCADVGPLSFNGDFVLPTYTPSKCNFIYQSPTPCYALYHGGPGGPDRIVELNLAPTFGDNQITVYVIVGGEAVLFVKSYGTVYQPDCIVTDMNIDLSYSTLSKCDGWSATCHITAL